MAKQPLKEATIKKAVEADRAFCERLSCLQDIAGDALSAGAINWNQWQDAMTLTAELLDQYREARTILHG